MEEKLNVLLSLDAAVLVIHSSQTPSISLQKKKKRKAGNTTISNVHLPLSARSISVHPRVYVCMYMQVWVCGADK